VLFAFRHSQEYETAAPVIGLRGLDERAVYRVESVDGTTGGDAAATKRRLPHEGGTELESARRFRLHRRYLERVDKPGQHHPSSKPAKRES